MNLRDRINRIDEKVILFVIMFGLSLIKGWHSPHRWTYTNYVVNYGYGFMRRGLLGTISTTILGTHAYEYEYIFYFMLILFALMVILLIVLTLQLISKDKSFITPAIIFAASPIVVFLSSEFGFLDEVGLLLILAYIFVVWNFGKRLTGLSIVVLTSFISIATILIHEGQVIMFGPVLMLTTLIFFIERATPIKKTFAALTFLAMLMFVTSVAVVRFGTLETSYVDEIEDSIRSKVNFSIASPTFSAIHWDTEEASTRTLERWTSSSRYYLLLLSALINLPTQTILLWWGKRRVGVIADKTVRRMVFAMFIITAISPYALNLVGIDMHRWNSLSVVTTFLGLMLVCRFVKDRVDTPTISFAALILFVFISAMSTNFLYNAQPVHLYPFVNLFDKLTAFFLEGARFPVLPQF
ncbi:hypothetical protein KC614_00150 [candidate division WWE3 bacterium]|uniref:Uncharacterized protein n=1 Tax=candidate division WWE3 bacterium TaxID=2053526 RepID=A0A955RQM5_UNCKA|nr:hypothetical protein [candidate division WWE3 bacterium]